MSLSKVITPPSNSNRVGLRQQSCGSTIKFLVTPVFNCAHGTKVTVNCELIELFDSSIDVHCHHALRFASCEATPTRQSAK